MRIHVQTGQTRKAPKAGDIRLTKKYGNQIRIPTKARDFQGRVIGLLFNGGRQNYHWATEAEARAEGETHFADLLRKNSIV